MNKVGRLASNIDPSSTCRSDCRVNCAPRIRRSWASWILGLYSERASVIPTHLVRQPRCPLRRHRLVTLQQRLAQGSDNAGGADDSLSLRQQSLPGPLGISGPDFQLSRNGIRGPPSRSRRRGSGQQHSSVGPKPSLGDCVRWPRPRRLLDATVEQPGGCARRQLTECIRDQRKLAGDGADPAAPRDGIRGAPIASKIF
jgi:hypothetical protein